MEELMECERSKRKSRKIFKIVTFCLSQIDPTIKN